jgi:hypothetical protein
MLRKSFLIFAVLCAVFLIGCGKTEVTVNNSNSNSATKEGDKPVATSSSADTAPSSGEKIGIPECDDFITKYDACVSGKVPEAQRAQYQNTIKQWRDSWRELAKNPMTKGVATAACKQAAESAKTSMKEYNCSF